jgi:transcriptional regulator with XRE-family HTH domain
MSIFGERLIEARKRQHLTQIELADMIGMSRSGIGGYEKEGKDASYEVLVKLVRALGVTSDYLLGIDDNAGWMNRTHIAEKFYDLELLYDRADSAQQEAIDAVLGEVDQILARVMEAPEAVNLAALYDLVKAMRILVVNDNGER